MRDSACRVLAVRSQAYSHLINQHHYVRVPSGSNRPHLTITSPVIAAAAIAVFLPIQAGAQQPERAQETGGRRPTRTIAVRATRLVTPIRVDGNLDEPVYQDTPAVSDFTQLEPRGGEPASQPMQVWFFFDSKQVYVSAKLHEDHPERMVANEMRHDAAATLSQNELFNVFFDTFRDRRNAYHFFTSPIGGNGEAQVTNERSSNVDWNGVWNHAVGRFEGGWTVELTIPFKTLRYQAGADTPATWGVQVTRINRWKNEISSLVPIDPALGISGSMQVSGYAALEGIEAPSPSMNLEVKPYAIADITTDRVASPGRVNDIDGAVGVDAKYAVTEGMTADFTYNTDFAQVEADEQQINLTRFSLFFPEKREFFLENAGIFDFGGTVAGIQGTGSDAPLLFYSRRIGLQGTREVPLLAGGRLTGRVGRFSIGVLDIQSTDDPVSGARSTNAAVLRVKRDILRRSAVGMLATRRSLAESGVGSNEVVGLDGTFAFFSNLTINTYWAHAAGADTADGQASYRAQLSFTGDRYGLELDHLRVGENFTPDLGFVRRHNIDKNLVLARFSPRPRNRTVVRKYSYVAAATDINDTRGQPQSREVFGEFGIEFQSSDKLLVGYNSVSETLPRPFTIARGVTLPTGSYDFGFARASFTFGQQRRMFGTASVERGSFYNGERTSVIVRQGRVRIHTQVSLEPTFSINRVHLPEGAFTATLAGTRMTWTVSPRMFLSALIQRNTSNTTVSTNVRLRWEYRPRSEVFLVFNDQRDTAAAAQGAMNRTLVVKINRLLQF